MAKIFPEDMNRLDPNNIAQSLRTIEDYIRYMTERIEFNTANRQTSIQSDIDFLEARVAKLEKE